MRRAAMLLPIVLVACKADSTAPVINVQGTFVGIYTATVPPGVVYQGVLQLTQNGNAISGTLAFDAARAALVTGSIDGNRITATFTYTDGCVGSSSSTVDVLNHGERLVGSYTTNDCLGQYSGGYDLNRHQ